MAAALALSPTAWAGAEPHGADSVPPPALAAVETPDPAGEGARAVAAELALRLSSEWLPAWMPAEGRSAARWKGLHRFYKQRDFAPVWLHGDRLGPAADDLAAVVRRCEDEGLEPSRYASLVETVAASSEGHAWPTALADRELRLTFVLLALATDLLEGRISPRGASAYWAASPVAEADGATLLTMAVQEGPLRDVLETLAPQHPQYALLRRVLAAHREVAAAGGWPVLPALPPLRRGIKHPQVPSLRERLTASGDLPAAVGPRRTPEVFDRSLEQGLKRFQWRHGLPPHGRLDQGTYAALNVPVEERIAAIELNLERWRWLPRTLDVPYVLVNVPAFELHAVGADEDRLRMKVITGKAGETPTPIFSATLTTVIFSPWWNVPPRIAEEEVMPAVRRDRRYLRQRNMELVSVESGPQFRQRPGPTNPMGLVKFLLPNPFHVYLHDTPKDFLFKHPRRDFSHGCVRVEHPMALTQWLLRGPDWSRSRIQKAMRARQEAHVPLQQPTPVHVAYFTVWVDDGGTVRFLPDVYGHDEPQLRILRGSSPWQRMAEEAPRDGGSDGAGHSAPR